MLAATAHGANGSVAASAAEHSTNYFDDESGRHDSFALQGAALATLINRRHNNRNSINICTLANETNRQREQITATLRKPPPPIKQQNGNATRPFPTKNDNDSEDPILKSQHDQLIFELDHEITL